RQQVASRMLVDGAWHSLPAMTREVGDSILSSLKSLSGLNPADRRSRQQGMFNAATEEKKMSLELISQGTKTGERVQLKFIEKRKTDLTLPELGMWPEMINELSGFMNQPGMVLISAPARSGLTTTWRAGLLAGDRITRDWIAIVDQHDHETDVENVVVHQFNNEKETAESLLRKQILTQPDAVVVPKIESPELLNRLVEEGSRQERTIVTRANAKSAAEALLQLHAMAPDKKLFAQTINCVIGQRLARRLCAKCKTPVRVQPKLIQQLGGDPKKNNTLYNQFRMPPPEQQVDENGKPIVIKPCRVCSGIGYIGRISIYEMIKITPEIREALVKQPKLEVIRKLATKSGDLTMLQQGYRLALLGVTSLAEVQRVMKD
ncbi:MAG: ATPase, T2SS/T4P/T4SS family, partial [Planctomycetota bacterium]